MKLRYSTALALLILMLFQIDVASASDNVVFSFQGRIFSLGQPVDGTVEVKFALVDTSGTTTVWSNDESSTAGSEPSGSVALTAESGLFDVMVGDTSLGMAPMHGALFNGREDLRLRVWLSDGVNGFEQLLPDRQIPNTNLLGLRTLTEPLTIFVDATNGSDLNGGLEPGKAKQSISAAVGMLPNRIQKNATIKIADGIYRESVDLLGFNVSSNVFLSLVGDETCSPTLGQVPAVRITGTDSDITPSLVRSLGITIGQSNNIRIKGLLVDYFAQYNFACRNSNTIYVHNSQFSDSGVTGYLVSSQGDTNISDTLFSNNADLGALVYGSYLAMSRCYFNANGYAGIRVDSGGRAYIGNGRSYFNNNGSIGIQLASKSLLDTVNGTATATGNTGYGVQAEFDSYVRSRSNVTATGNGSGAHNFDATSQYN